MYAVIARSFAFIYSRNQPSLGLLGIVLNDEEFFEIAQDNVNVTIDVSKRFVEVTTSSVGRRRFPFDLSETEYRLTMNDGISAAYRRYRSDLWFELTKRQNNSQETDVLAMIDEVTEGGTGMNVVERDIDW